MALIHSFPWLWDLFQAVRSYLIQKQLLWMESSRWLLCSFLLHLMVPYFPVSISSFSHLNIFSPKHRASIPTYYDRVLPFALVSTSGMFEEVQAYRNLNSFNLLDSSSCSCASCFICFHGCSIRLFDYGLCLEHSWLPNEICQIFDCLLIAWIYFCYHHFRQFSNHV